MKNKLLWADLDHCEFNSIQLIDNIDKKILTTWINCWVLKFLSYMHFKSIFSMLVLFSCLHREVLQLIQALTADKNKLILAELEPMSLALFG